MPSAEEVSEAIQTRERASRVPAEVEYVPMAWEKDFLEAISENYGITESCRLVKAKECNYSNVRHRRNKHPEFERRFQIAREMYIDSMTHYVAQEAKKDPKLGLQVLERLASKEWAPPQQRVQLSNDEEAPITLQVVYVSTNVRPEEEDVREEDDSNVIEAEATVLEAEDTPPKLTG